MKVANLTPEQLEKINKQIDLEDDYVIAAGMPIEDRQNNLGSPHQRKIRDKHASREKAIVGTAN